MVDQHFILYSKICYNVIWQAFKTSSSTLCDLHVPFNFIDYVTLTVVTVTGPACLKSTLSAAATSVTAADEAPS